MKHFSLKTLALSTFLTAATFTGALAQDANAVADRLKAVLEAQGIAIAWSGVSGDATNVVLEGVTVRPTTASEGETASLGTVTLADVVSENGGYTIGNVTMGDFSRTEAGTTVDITGISLAGLKLPAENAADPLSVMMMYQNADVGAITVKEGDSQVFAMNNIHFELSPPADGQPLTFSGNAESFNADLSKTTDPQSKAAIDALGYQQINGSFEVGGSWNPSDGRFAISKYDITVDNAGTLGFTLDLGGYTTDFIKAMQDAQKAGGDSGQQGMQMLGLMQQLTFHSLSVRFDDDSLTNKVLDFVGSQQGMKGSDIANQMKAVVPILLAQAGLNDIAQPVSEAVTKYLDDPKSIEIAAAPASPVPFALIIAGAMSGQPQSLVGTLGVTVKANED
ncbi:MAG: hypothetical protein AB7S80_19145 [Rhizobiaceae bacterium]